MFFLHILGGASYAFGCAVYLLFSIILRHCHSYLCCNALIFKNSCAIILLKMLVDPLDFTLIKWHIAVCVSWLLHREPSLVSPAGSGTSGSDSPPDCHSIPSVSLRYSRMTRWGTVYCVNWLLHRDPSRCSRMTRRGLRSVFCEVSKWEKRYWTAHPYRMNFL